MNYVLTLLSVCLETAKNIFCNHFSKNTVTEQGDIFKFNSFLYLGAGAVLLPVAGRLVVSTFSFWLAVLFAFITVLSQICYMQALRYGSMAYSTFFSGCGMLLPIACGILFWGEKIYLNQMAALPLLILSMLLSLVGQRSKPSVKWLLYSFLTLIFTGGIGIVQSIHQASEYREELNGFLVISFFFMVALNGLFYLLCPKGSRPSPYRVKSGVTVTAVISGGMIGIVNSLNLYLAGVMPKVIFFPLVNGGLIFASLLAAVILFRERLSKKQWAGICLGIFSLCLLSL